MSQSLYRCDGCSETILPQKARIHCDDCVGNHNICANCYVVGQYTQQHVEAHSTSLIDKSGYQPKPPPIPRRPLAASPQSGRPVSQHFAALPNVMQQSRNSPPAGSPQFVQPWTTPPPPGPPSTAQQFTASSLPGPPPIVQQPIASPLPGPPPTVQQPIASPLPGPPPTIQQPMASSLPGPPPIAQQPKASPLPGPPPIVQQLTASPQSGPTLPLQQPVASSPPVAQQIPTSTSPSASLPAGAQPRVQGGWQPLFYGSAPTATMVAFLEAVFMCLDTDKDGLLTPEQYSAFLDVQGYGPEEDVWKKSHKEYPGYTADDVADFELKTSYENFSIQHKMQARPNPTTSTYMDDLIDSMSFNASFASLMKGSIEKKSFSNGMMPMLMLPGFIDITTIETLCDPNPGWIRVNRIAQHYNIWREWGDVPRSMMPDVPPKELMAKIAIITQQSAARAQTMINANATELAIKAQGQENVLRLLDPPGTKYVYRYN